MTPEEHTTMPVRVGLLGCGNVGGALAELLVEDGEAIFTRTGLRLELVRVAVRNTAKTRGPAVPEHLLTNDAAAVVAADDVDVVVELIGGIEPARSLILDALKAGKPVVTGNKELVADLGEELFQAAAAAGVDLLFEASVAGGIPIIRPLRESLAAERLTRVMGIVNGTPATPPPTSRASTPRPRRRSSPRWPSARRWWLATWPGRASAASSPAISPSPGAWAS